MGKPSNVMSTAYYAMLICNLSENTWNFPPTKNHINTKKQYIKNSDIEYQEFTY